MASDANTTYEKRLPKCVDCCNPRLDLLGANRESPKSLKIGKRHQKSTIMTKPCANKIWHETKFAGHAVALAMSDPLAARGKIPQNEVPGREEINRTHFKTGINRLATLAASKPKTTSRYPPKSHRYDSFG